MLRDTIANPSIPLSSEKKTTALTLEDIENFYRLITKASYDPSEHFHEMLQLVKNNCYDYLNFHLTEIKKRILLGQIALLKENKFFENKFDLAKLEAIIQDISNKSENVKSLLKEEEHKTFLSLLHNINNEYQTQLPTIKSFPDTLKTGLSTTERQSLSYSSSSQTSSPGISINNKGIAHLQKKEWQEAISLFEQAIAAEHDLAHESKKEINKSLMTIYQRNLTLTYARQGMHFLDKELYTLASEKLNLAILSFEKIELAARTKKDKDDLVLCQQKLSVAYNLAGMQFFSLGDIDVAINNHELALSTHKKIREESLTEEDKEFQQTLIRNLVYVLYQRGILYYYNNHFDAAIEKYQASMTVFDTLQPELKKTYDTHFGQLIKHNLNMAKLRKTLPPLETSQTFFSQPASPMSPKKEENKTDEPDRKRQKKG